jgi:rod shape-determining protein MreC
MHRQTLTLLVILCLGHVLLISAQVQSKTGSPLIESIAFDSFAKAQEATSTVADTVHGGWSHYFALRGAARENEGLKQRVLELEAEVQQQQALVDRSRSLEDLLVLKHQEPAPTMAARVIAGSPSPDSLTVTIDRGKDDGVAADMAVMAARGVVGRVINPVAAHAATVQLLIGHSAAAAVTFERSQSGGMVVGGALDPPLRAKFVPTLASVQAGERVTTSGQDGIYPPGLLVGTVERVSRAAAEDREIAIAPSVDFSHIDVVLIVLSRQPRGDNGQP